MSSAWRKGVDFSKLSGKSLMYSRKNNGPRIEPWGIPFTIILGADVCPLTQQTCVLLFKYDENHFNSSL